MGAGRGDTDEFLNPDGMYKASEGYDMDAFDRIISGEIKIDKNKAKGNPQVNRSASDIKKRYKGDREEIMNRLEDRNKRKMRDVGADKAKVEDVDDYEKIQEEKEALEAKIQAEKNLILEKLEIKHRKEKERIAEKERQAALERAEKDRMLAQAAEAAERERQRRREELERLERERLEQEKLEQEKLEQERLERERQERLEQERLERERLEQERLEQERLEQERLEAERLEQDRIKKEAERLEREKRELEWLEREQERIRQAKIEKERLEAERIDLARREEERLEQEKLEAERLEQARLEQEELEEKLRTKLSQEQARLEEEKIAREQQDLDERMRVQFELEEKRAESLSVGADIEEHHGRLGKYDVPEGLNDLERLEHELEQAKAYAEKLERLVESKRAIDAKIRDLEVELSGLGGVDLVDDLGVERSEARYGEDIEGVTHLEDVEGIEESLGSDSVGGLEDVVEDSDDGDATGSEEVEYDPLDAYLEVDDGRLMDSSEDISTGENLECDIGEGDGDLDGGVSAVMGSTETSLPEDDPDIIDAQKKAQELVAQIQARDAELYGGGKVPKEARDKVIKPPKSMIKAAKGEEFEEVEVTLDRELDSVDYVEIHDMLVDKYSPIMDDIDSEILLHGRSGDYLRGEIVGVLVNYAFDASASGGSSRELDLLYEEAMHSYTNLVKDIEDGVYDLMASEVEDVEKLLNECIEDIDNVRNKMEV